jgi:hypothetical protein
MLHSNDTQPVLLRKGPNDTQLNGIQHSNTQHYENQHNYIQHNGPPLQWHKRLDQFFKHLTKNN